MMKIQNQPLQIITIAIIFLSVRGCQDDNCNDCDTYIKDSSGTLSETCFSCNSGYKLDDSGQCVQDDGLVIGIAIGAVAALVAQVICYIYCRIRYGDANKKKSELTLEDIYNVEHLDNKPEGNKAKKEGEDVDQSSQSIKSEFKVYITHACGVCDEEKTSIKTACGHFFHHECFKTEIIKAPDICPKCIKRALSPIEMMCCKCLNKKRSIPLESISNFYNFREYICITCKLKIRNEEAAKKWWKCCC